MARRHVATVAALVFSELICAQTNLPDGPGKTVVERECTRCHGLSQIVKAHRSRDRWATIVDEMVSRGAQLSDVELDEVVDYLAKNFGRSAQAGNTDSGSKLNVNKADASQIASALSLSQDTASAIVKYRREKGEFRNLDDLKRVPGVDGNQIEAHKDQIEF
jgi:competence protein ComEA